MGARMGESGMGLGGNSRSSGEWPDSELLGKQSQDNLLMDEM